ncbi:unnamed protein product, partial [Sphacelaria rigidula]
LVFSAFADLLGRCALRRAENICVDPRHHPPCAPGGYGSNISMATSTAGGIAGARMSGVGKAALSALLEIIQQSNGRRKMVRDHDECCRAT